MINEIRVKTRAGTVVHKVVEDEPHIKSWASLIMLKNYYRILDDSMFDVRKYMEFRHEFLLEEQAKSEGKLVCVYCGRDDLIIGHTELWQMHRNAKIKNLATVDHIVPRESGTNPYDKDKCCVSCRKCNGKKANKDPKTLDMPKYGNINIDTYKLKYFRR